MPSNFETLVFSIIATDAGASAAFDRFRGKVAATSATVDAANAKMNANAAAMAANAKQANATGTAFGVFAGRLGPLQRQVSLFGGALGALPVIGTVTGLHLLIDGIAETAAVLLPATIAFGAFAAAAVPTVQSIIKQFQNLQTVSAALGKNIYPLTGGFQKIADAVQPKVYQLLGDALVVINSRTGELGKLAVGAGTAFDQLAARATAALVSGGMSAFLKNAVADLSKIGDVVGNIFGTVGNLLKAMPGYAETLLGVLDGVTKGLEAFTGSGFVQGIVRAGLSFHGLALYAGLAGTAVSKVAGPALGGISKLALNAAVRLESLAGRTTAAGEGMLKFSGWAEKAAQLPWGWIGAAAIGLGILVFRLVNAKDATQQWFAAQQAILAQTPAVKGFTLAQQDQAVVSSQLASAQEKVGVAQKNVAATSVAVGHGFAMISTNVSDARAKVADYTAAQSTLQGQVKDYQTNLAALAKQFGGTTQAQNLLAAAGITWGQVATKNKSQVASIVLQMQAADSAFKAMSLGTGRQAAAMNALNISMGTGSTKLAAYLAQAQKMVTAEDAVTQVVLGGEQGFLGFEQAITGVVAKLGTPPGLAAAAKVAGANLNHLNAASINLANNFYNTAVPAAQSLIDKLQLQDISTGHLTTAIATQAKQMIPYIGHNTEARAVIVSLINNALGPGTVSLKTLNKWVAQNSTTLQGFNKLVAQSTINAGALAGVLKNQLNVQFHQDLLSVSGANAALKTYTQDILNNTTATSKGKADRARLIADLENAGFSAKQATAYVNGLNKTMANIRGRNVSVTVHGSGTGTIKATEQGLAAKEASLSFAARGMRIPGYGGGDRHLIMAESGETVVPKHLTPMVAPLMKANKVPGFASGGMIGGLTTAVPWMASGEASFAKAAELAWARAIVAAFKHATAAAAGAPGAQGGPTSAGAAQAQAYARSRLGAYGWSSAQMGPLIALWNQESGWNRLARNASSGAYGIPQALPPSKMGAAANPPTSSAAAQINWGLGYIRSVYGSPSGAEAHELSAGWYGRGFHGSVNRPTLFGAGERGRERVDITPAGHGGPVVVLQVKPGAPPLSQAVIGEVMKHVRVAGGGDVQVALGG